MVHFETMPKICSSRWQHHEYGSKLMLSGLLVVDKPIGWSSMDVVRHVRRAAGGVKTGHAGTLDPLATGVVICCLGKATKLVPRLMDLQKVYETQIDLSAFTVTDDLEGPREDVDVEVVPDVPVIAQALRPLIGWIDQKPPAYSAIHVKGQRSYRLARRGEHVDLPTRKVRVDSIELVDYTWPTLTLTITCGKGTYIRSIARDLGVALGTGGHLSRLRRTRVGGFDLSIAVTDQRLKKPITEIDLVDPDQYLTS